MKDSELKDFMREFEYEDKRVSHLLALFDDWVRFIRDYDENFALDDKKHEPTVLAGYRNSAFGILFSLLQLGHITTQDFHMRLHALNTVFFQRASL